MNVIVLINHGRYRESTISDLAGFEDRVWSLADIDRVQALSPGGKPLNIVSKLKPLTDKLNAFNPAIGNFLVSLLQNGLAGQISPVGQQPKDRVPRFPPLTTQKVDSLATKTRWLDDYNLYLDKKYLWEDAHGPPHDPAEPGVAQEYPILGHVNVYWKRHQDPMPQGI